MGEAVKATAKTPAANKENIAAKIYKSEISHSISCAVDKVMSLQRAIGNKAVERLMRDGTLQAKLRVSQPGDIYEQEADHVAQQVMLMPEPQVSESGVASSKQQGDIIQRKCPGCAGKSGSQKEDEEMKLQAKEVTGQKPDVKPETEMSISAIRGGGNPLPENLRSFFETRLGHDFGQVRVHDDAKSAESALAINARAFTVGTDVVFGAGEYKPETSKGHRLLAHELTHVMQQQVGLDRKLKISTSGDTVSEAINATILRKEGDEKQPEQTEKSKKDKIKINYGKARKANQAYAKADSLGWEKKLNTISGGKYKAWADLWKDGKYDEFADALATYQTEQGMAKKDIDGILGLQTWATIGGIGEAMAGIGKVYWEKEGNKSEDTCFLASEERIKRGHKLATGKDLELPEDRTTDIFNVILKSIPNRMLDVDSQYRGAGAAGALVYAGIGEFVPESDIWVGKLRPGAALQVWGHKKAYDLLQAGEIEENGEKRRITDADAGLQGVSFYGTSFVFVRYDSKTNEKMLVRHYGGAEWKSKSDFEVWIAANIQETPQKPVE